MIRFKIHTDDTNSTRYIGTALANFRFPRYVIKVNPVAILAGNNPLGTQYLTALPDILQAGKSTFDLLHSIFVYCLHTNITKDFISVVMVFVVVAMTLVTMFVIVIMMMLMVVAMALTLMIMVMTMIVVVIMVMLVVVMMFFFVGLLP